MEENFTWKNTLFTLLYSTTTRICLNEKKTYLEFTFILIFTEMKFSSTS